VLVVVDWSLGIGEQADKTPPGGAWIGDEVAARGWSRPPVSLVEAVRYARLQSVCRCSLIVERVNVEAIAPNLCPPGRRARRRSGMCTSNPIGRGVGATP
jgi:hypothetical protein